MNESFLALITERYAQLNVTLNDFLCACEMEPSEERTELLNSIKQRTNHTGLHYTTWELMHIFLGRTPLNG